MVVPKPGGRAAKDILRRLQMPFASFRQREVGIVARLKLLMVDIVGYGEGLVCLRSESAQAILRGS